jgi:hypothetical protein
MINSTLGALKPFYPAVMRSRRSYLDAIAGLPAGLREVAVRNYHDRIRRAAPRPLLGEYVPWLVADILGISDVPAVQKIATGWLHIYFFTLILDDVIDRAYTEFTPQDLITGSLLLQRGLCQMLDNSPRHLGLSSKIDSAFADTAKAAVEELVFHRRRVKAFTTDDICAVGQKIALLRICADAVAELHCDGSRRLPWLHAIVENLATGIQLLDDIQDWEEDYRAGNMTLLLTLAAQREPTIISIPASLDSKGRLPALLTLVESRAIEESLNAALTALSKTKSLFEQDAEARHSQSAIYLSSLLQAGQNVKETLKKARVRLRDVSRRVNEGNMGSEEREFVEKEKNKILEVVDSSLETIAQGS